MSSERVTDLMVAAQELLDSKGCHDPDCCDAAIAEAAAREGLSVALFKLQNALAESPATPAD